MPRTTAPPAFCETIGTLSALSFGARRLPELSALHRVATTEDDGSDLLPPPPSTTTATDIRAALQSGGRKTSSRHLRRRATSHVQRYKRRYHRNISSSSKNIQTSDDDIEQHPREGGRRWRRQQRQRLYATHEAWQRPEGIVVDDTKQSGVHWMTTHVWHRKRFHMQTLWNWSVPLLHTNRGGAAALRLVTTEEHCVLQDVTWSAQPIYFRVIDGDDNSSLDNRTTTSFSWIQAMIPDFSLPEEEGIFTCREAMIFEPHAFPQKAIGPVFWIYSPNYALCTTMPDHPSSEHDSSHHLYFFMHPAIQSTVRFFLERVRPPHAPLLQEGPHHGGGIQDHGVACLQLRGSNSACINCLQSKAFLDLLVPKDDFGKDPFDQTLRNIVQSHHNESVCVAGLTNTTSIFLRRVAPRNAGPSSNWGVCGVDIYCRPSECPRLFASLVLSGGACPVGMAEAAFLALECDPPLLLFPRDYPDTLEGTRYWKDTTCIEWQYVRQYWEGGGGRISANPKPNPWIIDWSILVHPEAHDNETPQPQEQNASERSIVVVRGEEFLAPFHSALSGLTHPIHQPILFKDMAVSTKRRRRHRSLHGTTHRVPVVEAPRLAAPQRAAHQRLCRSFLEAFSLPAALVGTIQIIGKGTLCAGWNVYSDSDGQRFLGHVTAGAFSMAWGQSHGIAIVGARSMLQSMLEFCVDPRSSIVIASSPWNGRQTVQWRVYVQNGNGSRLYEASFSLPDFWDTS